MNRGSESVESVQSIVEILARRAVEQPSDRAYTFLDSGERDGDSMTWSDLDARSRALASRVAQHVDPGARVLLLFPPGLGFLPAFFGCMYARAISILAYPPSGSRHDTVLARLRGIVADAGVSLAIGPSAIAEQAAGVSDLLGIPWLNSDDESIAASSRCGTTLPRSEDVAFLQYTSGSTTAPRGVMVTHANLLHNLECSAELAGHGRNSASVSWLPVNHDMGLIEGVLQPLYSGFPACLMAPAAFLQRPIRWLRAISRVRATHSGGPNFAYDLCVRRIGLTDRESLNLSTWRTAFTGSEPVRRQTLEAFERAFGEYGFRSRAFRPAYGLAESTLLVTSDRADTEPLWLEVDSEQLRRGVISHATQPASGPARTSIVAAGSPHHGMRIAIVDPERYTRCDPDRVGEIWVAGGSVAKGYWRRHTETIATFRGFIAGTHEGPFLRTGDLGFVHGGRLFVTGRIKDVLIVRGLKHYPQDIESTIEHSHPAVRRGSVAAFAIDSGTEERVALAAEVDPRVALDPYELERLVAEIRRRAVDTHSIHPCSVVLLPPGTLPKTTSGKLQRFACRDAFLQRSWPVIAGWEDTDGRLDDLERAAS